MQSELNKRKDLKQVKAKLDKSDLSHKTSDYNMIYKFKLGKSKGDSLFSSVNEPMAKIGSALGVRTNSYLDHVKRFEMSKQLVSNAAIYEKNLIRGFTDLVVRKIWRNKMNYMLKGGLGLMFLYSLSKANENKNLFVLRKHSPAKLSEISEFYFNPSVAFIFAFLTFAYL